MAQSGCSTSGLERTSHVLCPPSQYHRHSVTLAMCPLPHPPLIPACLHHFALSECQRAGVTLHGTFPVSLPLLGHIHSFSVFCGFRAHFSLLPIDPHCLSCGLSAHHLKDSLLVSGFGQFWMHPDSLASISKGTAACVLTLLP